MPELVYVIQQYDPSQPVIVGGRYQFDYSAAFTTLPEYTAHAGQKVVVIRPLTEDEAEPPDPENDITQMYRIRADDGWEGDAWTEELVLLARAGED